MPNVSIRPFLSIALAALTLAACSRGDDGVKSYEAPKETLRAPAPPPTTMAQPPGATDPGSMDPTLVAPPPPAMVGMSWTLPEGWSEVENTSPMRFATLKAGSGLEVSISHLTADGGGVPQNINRWRNQVGLDPMSTQELMAEAEQITVPGALGVAVDLEGPALRMLAAIFPVGANTWFIKATGPDNLVGPEHEAFMTLCRSVSFSAEPPAGHPPMTTPGTGSGGADDLPPMSSGGAGDGGGGGGTQAPASSPVTWTALPDGWEVDAQPATMSVVSITTSAPGGAASITITPLGGQQDLMSNVNRWRGQVGLPTAGTPAEAGVREIPIADRTGWIVDAAGPQQRIMGAITIRDGATWFFKIRGSNEAVAPHAAAFEAFLGDAAFR